MQSVGPPISTMRFALDYCVGHLKTNKTVRNHPKLPTKFTSNNKVPFIVTLLANGLIRIFMIFVKVSFFEGHAFAPI